MEKVIVNGEIISRSDSKLDVEDRGYQFGDGVYEVVRVYNGKLFTANQHISRLLESAEKISLTISYSVSEVIAQLEQLVSENQLLFGTIYLQFTRGVAPRNHAFPSADVQPVFIAYTKELPYAGAMKNGEKALTTEDIRWLRCDIKSLNLLGNILAKQRAAEAGCFEAIQHREGIVTEGSSSNISIIKNGILKTHPATNFILNGITRQVMLKHCADVGIDVVEQTFSLEELFDADEVILTSTTSEIKPIVEIDGKRIGDGKPVTITKQLQQLFHQEIESECGTITAETASL